MHVHDRRMQLHLVTKEIWNVAMTLYPYLPAWVIDKLVLLMCAVVFGDTSRHGLRRPAVGPFTMKLTTPAYPVVDVGTYAKIRSGEIRVLPAAVKSVRGNVVEFGDGNRPPSTPSSSPPATGAPSGSGSRYALPKKLACIAHLCP